MEVVVEFAEEPQESAKKRKGQNEKEHLLKEVKEIMIRELLSQAEFWRERTSVVS